MEHPQKKLGRPPRPMPEPIPDTPENIVQVVVKTRNNLPVPLDFPQHPLLIEHSVDGEVIPQRPQDGYINATLLCKKAGEAIWELLSVGSNQSFRRSCHVFCDCPHRRRTPGFSTWNIILHKWHGSRGSLAKRGRGNFVYKSRGGGGVGVSAVVPATPFRNDYAERRL